jgi:hypothetical protein
MKSEPALGGAPRGSLSGLLGPVNRVVFYWGVLNTVLESGISLETLLSLGEGYGVSLGAEALLGDAAGPVMLFSGLRSDGGQYTADQEKREALEKLNKEIDDRVGNFTDSHPGVKREEVRQGIIRAMLAEQRKQQQERAQREAEIWDAYDNPPDFNNPVD